MKTFTVPKPTVAVDDGFYADARKAHVPSPVLLAQMAPAPEEFVEAAVTRFGRIYPDAVKNLSPTQESRIREYAEGRAALAAQLEWYTQQKGTQVLVTQDFYHTDTAITSLFPAWIESEIQSALLAEGLVSWLTFATETVDSTKVTALYDSTGVTERSLRKLGEGAELPRLQLTLADSIIYLHKYGRAIEASYEVTAAQRIDALAHHIRRIAAQVAIDETDMALHICIAGDGTTAGAAETNATDYDVAAAGTITYSDMLGWYLLADAPYRIDKAVCGDTDWAQIANLAEFKDAAFMAAPQGDFPGPKDIGYRRWAGGVTDSEYVDRLVIGLDSRHAIKKYVMGSFLQETDKIILRQTNIWTFSYWCGFRKFDSNAVCVLDANAVL